MKNIKFFLSLSILIMFASCKDDDNLTTDIVSEFVFLAETSFSMNELTNSTAGNEIEIHAQMLAEARTQDVVINLEITTTNAAEGTDFEIVSTSNTIVIPAGSFTSTEAFKIRAINNLVSSIDQRFINISISSVSDSSIKIGKGITNPADAVAIIEIVDDECSDDFSLFNNAAWDFAGSNTFYYSDYTGSFATAINGEMMTIIGDIGNYDLGISVITTLIPNPSAPTTGTIIFAGASTIGNDGTYDYRWILTEEGTYDICAKTIQLSVTLQYIDIYGPDPTAWIDWYISNINATLTTSGGTGPVAPTGTVAEVLPTAPDEVITISGDLMDVQGLSEVTINNVDLGINQTIPLAGEMTYALSEMFTIPSAALEGDYNIEIVATNIESLATTFTVVVTVSSAGCTLDYNVFDNANLTANASVTETDGTFAPYTFSMPVTATIVNDSIKIQGDFLDFFATELTVNLIPDMNDSTIGTTTFTAEDLGVHTDGFQYRLINPADGTYDACEGKIIINYTIEYEDAGNWIFYYKTETEFNL
jgi:hypothetical protein